MHAGLHESEDSTVCHQVPLKAHNVDMVSLYMCGLEGLQSANMSRLTCVRCMCLTVWGVCRQGQRPCLT